MAISGFGGGNVFTLWMEDSDYNKTLPLAGTKFPVYQHLFNQNNITWSDWDLIPFDDVITQMSYYVEPLLGEFVEVNDDLAFLDISEEFFEYLFFHTEIWVWYDKTEEKFSIYFKRGWDNQKKRFVFINLITHKEEYFLTESALIKVKRGDFGKNKFKMWFELTISHMVNLLICQQQALIYNKKILKKSGVNDDSNPRESVIEDRKFYNLNSIITPREGKTLRYEGIELNNGSDLFQFFLYIHGLFDRKVNELGRVANLNDRDEKKTTLGEYKDIHAVANRQRLVLNQLKAFAQKAFDMWGIELEFAVNGRVNVDENEVDNEGGADVAGAGLAS